MSRGEDSRAAALDAAWYRYQWLRATVAAKIGDGSANQLRRLAVEFGLTSQAERLDGAAAAARAALDEVIVQLDRQAIIELCAAFEAAFRSRFPTAQGEASRLLGEHYRLSIAFEIRERLVREQSSFAALRDVFEWLVPGDSPRAKALRSLRNARNDAAHGVRSDAVPAMLSQQAYELLRGLIIDFL